MWPARNDAEPKRIIARHPIPPPPETGFETLRDPP